MPKKVLAPLRRTIKIGSKGKDVAAVKRAMRKWNHVKHGADASTKPVTVLWGPFASKLLKKFQRENHLKADGQYGAQTHKKMLKWIDAWGANLMQQYHPKDKSKKVKAVAAARFALAQCGPHYSQDAYWRCQGYYQKIRAPDTYHTEDCSGFVLWCYWIAGIYAGPYDGWTGTMQEHGKAVTSSQAQPGDAVFYNNHVAILVSTNPHMVATYGHEPGPQYTTMYYRTDIQEIRSYA